MGCSTLLWVSSALLKDHINLRYLLRSRSSSQHAVTMNQLPKDRKDEREGNGFCVFPYCKGMNSPHARFSAPDDLLDSNPASQRLSRNQQDPAATPALPDAGVSSQCHPVAGLRGQEGSLSMGGTARGHRWAEEERTTLLSESQRGIACVWSPASHHDRWIPQFLANSCPAHSGSH